MKMYYQKMIGGNGRICENIPILRESIKEATEEYYLNTKTNNEKQKELLEILHKITTLKTGRHIEYLGFQWGVVEMTEEQFENLEEFTGF